MTSKKNGFYSSERASACMAYPDQVAIPGPIKSIQLLAVSLSPIYLFILLTSSTFVASSRVVALTSLLSPFPFPTSFSQRCILSSTSLERLSSLPTPRRDSSEPNSTSRSWTCIELSTKRKKRRGLLLPFRLKGCTIEELRMGSTTCTFFLSS